MLEVMNKGDVIVWTYCDQRREVVDGRETVWSTTENRFVPIGGALVHFLTSVEGMKISWMNALGHFSALVNDAFPGVQMLRSVSVKRIGLCAICIGNEIGW